MALRLRGKRVFVVEDDLNNRVVYKLLFTLEGADIEFERYGAEAVSRLKRFGPVDIIILDLMLADGASGYTIFKEIRAIPEFLTVPIVAISSADPSEAIHRAQQIGFSGFIAKPLDQQKFALQIMAILKGEAVWYEG